MTDLRTIERDSIRAFVQSAADDGYLSGRVLDYGCGKQPYRDIVEAAGGEYVGYDAPTFPASTVSVDTTIGAWQEQFDSILCTQVVQYVPDPARDLLFRFKYEYLRRAERWGDERPVTHLVLTYPTNWPEVEPEDLHRFTKAGMERLLTEAGFEIVRHDMRAEVMLGDFQLGARTRVALGYGVIARA